MIAMKRSYIVLLIGVGTLVSGSIVFGVNSSTLATDFLTNNLIIKQANIMPGKQYTTEMTLSSSDTVSVLMRGQPFENKVQASITDKAGNTVWKETFNGDHISNFDAKKGQAYQVVIKNVDKTNVSVDAIIGNVPFMGIGNDAKTANVAGTLAGLGVGIVGIVILIVGGVLFFADRKPKKMVATN